MKKYILLFSFFFLFLSACENNQSTRSDSLPRSLGDNKEIVVIIDSLLWKGQVGRALRNSFSEELITPQPEPLFHLLHVEPENFNHILKKHHNLIFVTTLDLKSHSNNLIQRWLSEENIEDIKNDTSLYLYQKKNLYAKNQTGLFLFSNTTEQLVKKINENKQKLTHIFNQKEIARLHKSLYAVKEQKILAQNLFDKHNYTIQIPNGYELVKDKIQDKNGFTWLRFSEQKFDKHLIIAYKPYVNEKQTDFQKIIAWRDEIAKTYLFGDPNNLNSFILTETIEPPQFSKVQFKKHYAVKIQGLWRTNNISAGGPFISYLLVDNAKGVLYYVEGFVLAPGQEKRDLLRELEAIILSFGFN